MHTIFPNGHSITVYLFKYSCLLNSFDFHKVVIWVAYVMVELGNLTSVIWDLVVIEIKNYS